MPCGERAVSVECHGVEIIVTDENSYKKLWYLT